MHRVVHLESICGLLHDVGKPFLRYAMRAGEGLEERDEEILGMLKGSRDHEAVGSKVLSELLGFSVEEVCRLFRRALEYADRLAAAERGLREYAYLRDAWSKVESEVSKSLGLRYGHHYAPMLSPLWVLAKLGYTESTGPCGRGGFSADEALGRLVEVFKPLIEALDQRDPGKLSSSLSSLLGELSDKPLWFTPMPLAKENLRELSSATYAEALGRMDYLGVSRWLLRGLRLVSDLYGGRVCRGYVDTATELLKYTLATVPAAVYMALLPDTSLYSHSKLVAAYSSILSLGVDRFKLLVLDARRIQDFVASPVSAKAASRVIRGRSFLVELASLSLLDYVLELYGGLPYANVLTSEGGTLSLLVPALGEEREKRVLKALEAAVRSTHARLRGLWFTAALSKDFGLEELDYVVNLKGAIDGATRRGFLALLEDLERGLAVRKTVDEAESALSVNEIEIEGFDAITKEPVTRGELAEGYGLRVSAGMDYSKLLSGGKLEAGDLVNEATHLSLVAGTGLRNALLLASVYAYRQAEDGVLEPAADGVRRVLESVRARLAERLGRSAARFELYFRGLEFEGFELDVGLVPLETLGALHVMVSSTKVGAELPAGEALRRDLLRAAASAAAFIVRSALGGLSGADLRARIEVRLVNTAAEFVEALEHQELSRSLREALERGVDVHLGTLHAGTYHPSSPELVEGKLVGLAPVDLDSYNLVALAKADADWLGEVKKLLSFSPTRLSSLSDFLTTIITGKAHLVALHYARELARSRPGEPRGPVVLYFGGDDAAFYGYWVDVLVFLRRMYSDVFKALHPLSFTAAVALERSDYPLLELYRRVARALDDGKREARGWAFLPDLSSPRPVLCGDGRFAVTAGLRAGDAVDPGPSLATPLELFSSLARAIEALEDSRDLRERLADYRRELRMISLAGSLGPEEVVTLGRVLSGLAVGDLSTLYGLTRRSVALSYASARRREEFEKLGKILSDILGVGVKLHHEVGEDVRRSLLTAACSKTFVDVLLLYLSPFSREIRRPVG